MFDTYCGKSCQICSYRAETGCRGCREEASRECKLAHCCREKGHESCASCTYNTQCGMYRGKDTAPQFRLAKKKAELEEQQALREKGTFMAKWLWVLFWLFIPTEIASVMIELIPALDTAGYILSFVCAIVYGVVLLKLATQEKGYRKAGILTLIGAVLGNCMFFANETHVFLVVFLTVVVALLSIFSSYYEYHAHADVLEGLDNELSEKWRKLWSKILVSYIAMLVGALFVLVYIGWLIMLVASIAILVLDILKLVYLYRTAQAFQDVAAS